MTGRFSQKELESYLWEAANILRGSAVDRTDWKGYILPLLFFKRIKPTHAGQEKIVCLKFGVDTHRVTYKRSCGR